MNSHKTFLPGESIAFQQVLDRLKNIFESFGFIPHSTSVFEDVDLMINQTGIKDIYQVNDPTGRMQNIGLRVDHTVPLINFVDASQDKLVCPFKRYTTRPVYRPAGDSDGYTEYHSCDVDVIGRERLSLVYDAEILELINQTLKSLKISKGSLEFKICINNRQIVNAFFKKIKLNKSDVARARKALGQDNLTVLSELFDTSQMKIFEQFKNITGSNSDIIIGLRKFFCDQDAEAIDDLEYIYKAAKKLGLTDDRLVIVPTLTRNMEYYSGLTCCTYVDGHPEVGSICHGGRYDASSESSEIDFYGVGVSIQLSKLFDFLVNNAMIDVSRATASSVMVSGVGSIEHAMYISKRLRNDGIKTEMFLEQEMPVKNQIEYAKKRGFRLFVWTEEGLDRSLKADDIVLTQDLSMSCMPESRVLGEKAYGFFQGVKIILKQKSIY